MRRINYVGGIPLDLKEYERDVFIEELLTRLQLTFGGYIQATDSTSNIGKAILQGGAFGIVSTFDPAVVPDAFSVDPSATSATALDFLGGTVVFPNGEIVVLPPTVNVPVGNTAPGATSVVYMEFGEDETDILLTRYNVAFPAKVIFRTNSQDYIKTALLTDWVNFGPTDLQSKVPVALVTASSAGDLVVDYSRSTLKTNRPWFSTVDIQHRLQLGTGVVTSANAHGISFNDISAGEAATLFQLLVSRGNIVAKDGAISKVPGTLCIDDIPATSILTDTSGAVTGLAGAKYFYTKKYPVQLIRCTAVATGDPSDQTLDLGATLVPGRNLVFLRAQDEFVIPPQAFKISYVSVDALAPTEQAVITGNFELRSPATSETVVTGGLVAQNIVPRCGFQDANVFPLLYTVFLKSDGFVYKTPQVIYCYSLLDDIGTSPQTVTLSLLGTARLRVGLTNAAGGSSLLVTVKLTGKDASGNPIAESIVFNNTWTQDISVGTTSEIAITKSSIYKLSLNEYSVLDTIQISPAAVAAGPQAAIMVWADHELDQSGPVASPNLLTQDSGSAITDALPIAQVTWTGLQVAQDAAQKPLIRDVRPVGIGFNRYTSNANPFWPATAVAGASNTAGVWAEDFASPRYVSNGYFQTSPVHESANTAEVPRQSLTRMSKLSSGLSRQDFYVSRAIPVKNLGAVTPDKLRFVVYQNGPLNYNGSPGPTGALGFSLWARVYLQTNKWSAWYNVTGDTSLTTFVSNPPYYDITFNNVRYASGATVAASSGNNLIKFQFAVAGPCQGLGIVLDLTSALPSNALVWDSGAWS